MEGRFIIEKWQKISGCVKDHKGFFFQWAEGGADFFMEYTKRAIFLGTFSKISCAEMSLGKGLFPFFFVYANGVQKNVNQAHTATSAQKK